MSNPIGPEDAKLRDALRALPVPVPPADFDARVLAALNRPPPWWQALSWRRAWQPLQPLLLGTSCSLGLTLLLLHWTLSVPLTAPAPAPVPVQNLAAAPPASLPPLDALLDRPNLRAGSLAAAWNSSLLPEPVPKQTPRKPEPRRRAEISRQTTLVV